LGFELDKTHTPSCQPHAKISESGRLDTWEGGSAPGTGKGGVEKRGQSGKAARDMAMHGGCGKSLIELCLLSIFCTVPNAELMQGRFSGANWDFFALLFVWGVGVGGWAAAAVIGSGGW